MLYANYALWRSDDHNTTMVIIHLRYDTVTNRLSELVSDWENGI